MANASVGKIKPGPRRFAFECVFIAVFFRSAKEVPHETLCGDPSADGSPRHSGDQLDLGPISTRSMSRRPQHSIGDAVLIGMRLRSNTGRDESGLVFRVMKRAL